MGKHRRKIAVTGMALAMLVVLVPSAFAAPSNGNGNGKGNKTSYIDLSVSIKQDTPDPARVGDTVSYTVTVANSGATAYEVHLDVTLSGPDGTNSSKSYSWPSIGATPQTVTYSYTPTAEGTWTFKAHVWDSGINQQDTNSANNDASVTTTVNGPRGTSTPAGCGGTRVGTGTDSCTFVYQGGPLDVSGLMSWHGIPGVGFTPSSLCLYECHSYPKPVTFVGYSRVEVSLVDDSGRTLAACELQSSVAAACYGSGLQVGATPPAMGSTLTCSASFWGGFYGTIGGYAGVYACGQ